MVNVVGVGFGVLLSFLGVFVVYKGYQDRSEAKGIEDTETVAIADVEPGGDQRVQVEGTAREGTQGTLRAPIAETDGLVVETKADEQNEDPDRDGNVQWSTKERTVECVPFHVEDDTGTAVLRVPQEATLELDWEATHVGTEESPPKPVREVLDAADEMSETPDRIRRYAQGVVEPGESVFVLADPLEETPPRDADVVLGYETDPEGVVVSDRSESEVTEEKKRRGLAGYGIGAGLILFGLVLVAFSMIG